MASPVKNAAWLEWIATLMGGASRQTCAATFPPDHFYCLLDELPLQLIPRGFFASDAQPAPLSLNPECVIGPAKKLPPEFGAHPDLLAGFASQGTMAWVRDPASSAMLPFWLGPKLAGLLERLLAGGTPIQGDDPDVRVLAAAGILVPENYSTLRQEEWCALIEQSRPAFQTIGYVPVKSLLHPYHVAALRRYYRQMVRSGKVHLGDGQSSVRYVSYNEPVSRFFHHQIAGIVSAVAGEPVKPSYVYFASYLGGAELKKHTDRAQCEFSVTLCLDFSPEPEHETPWPIRLDTKQGTATIHQALGDGLFYRGTKLPHFRDKLPEGQTSTSIFFHYVPENFTGSLD